MQAHLKYEKSRHSMKASDSMYQTSVGEAEDSRQEWERDTDNCLSLFQERKESDTFEIN
jgi:hypothetical protein